MLHIIYIYKNHHSFYSGDVPYIAQQGARHQGETVLGTYRGAPDLHGARSGAMGRRWWKHDETNMGMGQNLLWMEEILHQLVAVGNYKSP